MFCLHPLFLSQKQKSRFICKIDGVEVDCHPIEVGQIPNKVDHCFLLLEQPAHQSQKFLKNVNISMMALVDSNVCQFSYFLIESFAITVTSILAQNLVKPGDPVWFTVKQPENGREKTEEKVGQHFHLSARRKYNSHKYQQC